MQLKVYHKEISIYEMQYVETNILDVVLEYIKNHTIWSDDDYPVNGFHIKPKPKGSRLDVVEINSLLTVYMLGYIKGIVNINIYHNNGIRIKQLSDIIELIMDNSLIDVAYFELDMKPNIFPEYQGKIIYKNLRYKFIIGNKFLSYSEKTNEFEINR